MAENDAQNLVNRTVLTIPQKPPPERNHYGHHHHRQHEQRDDESLAPQFVDDNKSEAQSEHELDGDSHDNQQQRVGHRAQDARVHESGGIVGEPDEPVVVGMLKVSPLETEDE
jgi:hypothetical protein